MNCPACHFDQPDGHTTCEACGLVFAKYDPNAVVTRGQRRQEREKLETPENGWATHHLGKVTWKSTPWTSTSGQGTTSFGGVSGLLLTLIVLTMFLGFPFVFLWPRTAMPFYFAGVFGLWGLFLFLQSFSKLREKREMEDIPFSTIRSMAPGQVEIHGTAAGTAPLQTPFTKKPCVYYEYAIEKLVRQGKDSNWTTIDKGGSRDIPFTLEDGTGKVEVRPQGSDTLFAHSDRVKAFNGKGLPVAITAFVQSRDLTEALQGSLRFTECCLEPGQEVFVMGVFQKKDGQDETYVGEGNRPDDLFLISDKSRQGVERQFLLSALGSMAFGLALLTGSVYGLVKFLTH